MVINPYNRVCTIQDGQPLAVLSSAEVIAEEESSTGSSSANLSFIDALCEDVSPSVGPIDRGTLKNLIQEFSDVFSQSEYDLGDTDIALHRIDTGEYRPFKQPLRRHPYASKPEIERQVQEMLKAGIIEPSSSPWASNVVMVRKKDGTSRFCIDFRDLNNRTKLDSYPLPRIDVCLDTLGGSRYFSSFDLRSGYHQVRMHPEDSEKTNFIVESGSYQFRRLAFGLCNAGATFQRVMDVAMHGANLKICLVYLDDIVVYSRSISEHIVRLRILFERLRKANLKLKPSKCHLLQDQISFLGHVVSAEGISTDPEKTRAIREWPIPTSVTEVRSFLGLASYYRKFVPRFSLIAKPLHLLTGKYVQFFWDQQCQTAFDRLK